MPSCHKQPVHLSPLLHAVHPVYSVGPMMVSKVKKHVWIVQRRQAALKGAHPAGPPDIVVVVN